MGSLFKKDKTDPEEQKRIEQWYEQINREMEWDSQFEDYSISEEWDKDFREAMDKAFEDKKRKQRIRKKVLAVASCMVVVLAGVGINQKEVIGECLKEVFSNESTEAGLEHTHLGTKDDLSIRPDEEQTRVDFNGNTLEEVYVQIKDRVKRPIFQVTDVPTDYEIVDAYYETSMDLIVIVLKTSEGMIYLSQETRLGNGGTGSSYDEINRTVWNENLQQYITITNGIQDAGYAFFVRDGNVVFHYFDEVSFERSREAAKNVLFQ